MLQRAVVLIEGFKDPSSLLLGLHVPKSRTFGPIPRSKLSASKEEAGGSYMTSLTEDLKKTPHFTLLGKSGHEFKKN